MDGKSHSRGEIIRGSEGRHHVFLSLCELYGPHGVFAGIPPLDEGSEFVFVFHFLCECYETLHEVSRDGGRFERHTKNVCCNVYRSGHVQISFDVGAGVAAFGVRFEPDSFEWNPPE